MVSLVVVDQSEVEADIVHLNLENVLAVVVGVVVVFAELSIEMLAIVVVVSVVAGPWS